MKIDIFKFITMLLFIIILSLFSAKFADTEEVYYPYPIVFVHGLNSSDDMWIGMRDELRQYFRTAQGFGECKYPEQISEKNYFIGCDYKEKNNGDIINIADKLELAINDALSYYPPSIPENARKVIIVCHSMGGLVTRTLLTKIPDYKNKIHRVVFIDTPHLGSPYASALWLFNEIKEDAKDNDFKNVMYHSYSSFSPFVMTYADSMEHPFLYSQARFTQLKINALLAVLNQTGPKPDKSAIDQLRMPAFTYYEKIYSGFMSNLTIYKSYSGSETFLGQNNLDVPLDYKVIVGKDPAGLAAALWKVADVLNLSDPFTFPTLAEEEQTLENAISNGDGIVTKSSQEAVTMNDVGNADYRVNGFHVGIADKCINEVLQAIDDAPVIEDVRFIMNSSTESPQLSDYMIIKVKDYLLADIELVQISGIDADLSDFYDDISDTYKPYIKFGRDFLTERYVTIEGKKVLFQPGEFYVKLNTALSPAAISITIKNAAGKETICGAELIAPEEQVDGMWRCLYRNFVDCGCDDYGLVLRPAAIDAFLNSTDFYSYPGVVPENQPDFHTSLVGGHAYSRLRYNDDRYGKSYYFNAHSDIASLLNFKLSVAEPVKSARLIGKFQFENYRQKKIETHYIDDREDTVEIIEERNDDFEVTFSFPEDNMSFILYTSSGETIDVPVEPYALNLNGDNTWTFSAEFLDDTQLIENCFPLATYFESPLEPSNENGYFTTYTIYRQRAYIADPLLVIIFTESEE